MSASDGAFRAAQRLGPYELVRELGRGGFASVWLARRQGPGGFESRVAIKLIRIELQTDPSFQKMLIDEAKLAAAIDHPNVVSIFELGEVDDILYLVMEYVSGRPLSVLRNMMQRAGKAMPVGVVMRVLADTCAGLHAAHELERDGKSLGVIHRDVSPQNILVSEEGAVKLIDFGVAKANDRLAADTTDGHTKGKLRYMAPEQALARSVDRRADVWAVGAVAFDLLEGHPPYDGHNDLARLFNLMDIGPPPTFVTNVPDPVAHVIRKALERDPDARWATASDMRAAIDDALDECGLRVTADDVKAFFGDALTASKEDDSARLDDGAILRARLQRPSAGAVTATIDVAPPAAATEPFIEEKVETLSALDTSPRGVPRRRSRILVAAVAGSLCLVGAAVVIGFRPGTQDVPATSAQSSPTPSAEGSERASSPPAASGTNAVTAAPPAANPVTSTSQPVIELPSTMDSSSVAPQVRPPVRAKTARPPPPKPASMKPATTKPATPAASPSSHPRYDDTIQ